MLDSTRIKTEIPGPKSKALMERRHGAVAAGIKTGTPVFAHEAQGATITDVDGNTFIDFGGGIGTMNVGHSDPRVVEAIKEQADRFTHTCFFVNHYESYVELAERINAMVPGESETRTAFFNSGAEAVENAVKVARYHTGRQGILAFENAFHGRTMLAVSLTSAVDPYKKGFGPFAPEIYRVPAPYAYRCPSNQDCSGGCRGDCFAAIERSMVTGVGADHLAAVIIEPVLGEGGIIPVPDFYMRKLRELCDQVGALLIVDEVQAGYGRTGTMLAVEHSGVEPDIVTTAKSMAAGMPLGGLTGKAEIMDNVQPGALGTTYGGNPLSCAAALAVLDAFEEDGLLSRAELIGERVTAGLREIQESHPDLVGDVRGRGAMVAMELVTDPDSKTPDADRTARIVGNALQEGLLLLTAGPLGNVLRVLVPLAVNDDQLEEGLEILGRAVDSAAEGSGEKFRPGSE